MSSLKARNDTTVIKITKQLKKTPTHICVHNRHSRTRAEMIWTSGYGAQHEHAFSSKLKKTTVKFTFKNSYRLCRRITYVLTCFFIISLFIYVSTHSKWIKWARVVTGSLVVQWGNLNTAIPQILRIEISWVDSVFLRKNPRNLTALKFASKFELKLNKSGGKTYCSPLNAIFCCWRIEYSRG